MKTCNRCKIKKELSEYGSNKRSKDGLRGMCKDCVNKQRRSKYRELMNCNVLHTRKQKLECTKRRDNIVALGIDTVNVMEEAQSNMSYEDAMHEIKGY